MTNGREMTPPSGFSTPPQIPNNTTSERPPVITTVFAATTPENTPFAYRASTSANPNPMISPAFVESNYKDYDEEREMEPRLEPNMEVTPTLRLRSHVVRRQRERVVGFEEAPNRKEAGEEEMPKGNIHLSDGGYIPQTFTNNDVPSYNGSMYPTVTPSSNCPFYTQPMYAPLNMPVYPNPTGSFIDSTSFVTPFVRWIEDYPLLDGLKIPSHIGSYDGKGDPDNFLHLFEGVIRMQKWLMPVACHMFTYTLKDSARIWWNIQKTGSILNYEDLKAKFRSHFSQQKKFTKTHLTVHNIKQRERESTRAFVTRYTNDTLQISGLHEEQCISGFIHGLRTRSLVEHLSTDLPSTYKCLMEKTYTWIEAREVTTNGTPNDRRENFERSRKSS
ncbi:reverse transcriptase domain-containing protein [Tanacetum coccineum]